MIYQPKLEEFELPTEDFMLYFESLLRAELGRRHIPFDYVELRDIGGANLDVYIYTSRQPLEYDFHYLGWSHLRRRTLREITLKQYAARYIQNYFVASKIDMEWKLRDALETLERENTFGYQRTIAGKNRDFAKLFLELYRQVIE